MKRHQERTCPALKNVAWEESTYYEPMILSGMSCSTCVFLSFLTRQAVLFEVEDSLQYPQRTLYKMMCLKGDSIISFG